MERYLLFSLLFSGFHAQTMCFPAPWIILVDETNTLVSLCHNCIIDSFSHFEVHVDLSSRAPERLCSIMCQEGTFSGLRKATLKHYSVLVVGILPPDTDHGCYIQLSSALA